MTKSTTNSGVALLNEAVRLHQSGKLDEAALLYQQILQTQPTHFDALHLSGLITKQHGNAAEAIRQIGAAINTVKSGLHAGHASALCNLGAAYQDNSQPDLALACYRQAVGLRPDYALAHNNLGNALKNLGNYHEALQSYRSAIRYLPNYPEAHYHCGLVLHLTGQFEPALHCFDQALQFRPQYAAALFARGTTLHACGTYNDAIDSYSRAIAVQPDFAQAYFNRAVSYNRVREFQLAVADFEHAIRCQPAYPKAFFYLANSLKQLNRNADAVCAYRQAGALGADPAQVDFALATLGVGATPGTPPVAYIRELFDQYADHFDAHLTEVLQYKIPEQIAVVLARHLNGTQSECLDLGCGTGLCGGFLRAHSGTLTGVDLSQNMLDQAAQLHLYDSLVCMEITDYLLQAQQQADLIVAADVLVYLGDLDRLMQAVSATLRHDGLFCFSVENFKSDQTDADYILQTSARYAHSESYLRRLARLHHLKLIEIQQLSGRQENQQQSDALIVLLQKVAGSAEL